MSMGASWKRRKKMKTLAKFVMLLALLAFCLPADGEILIFNKSMKCFEAEGQAVIDDPNGWTWDDVGDERITGYLILDVEYDEDGEIVEINDAHQVEYWREGRERWYEQWDEWFEVERIDVNDRWGRPIVYWVLEGWDAYEDEDEEYIWFVMLRGRARMVNIGLGWAPEYKREVAALLEGCCQELDWWEEEGEPPSEYIEKWMCTETLRLHPWWTRMANVYWELYEEDGGEGWSFTPFQWAIGGITDESYDFNGEEIVVEEDEPYGIVKAWLEWLGYEELMFMDGV